MHREVSILKTLESDGVPRLVESNSTAFETAIPLYMVAEYIPGKTLRQYVSDPLSVEMATNLVTELLETIEYCHSKGVTHRDVKPENIIVRDDSPATPVLIDFGISFNESESNETSLTQPLQQLGNRFLALPELHFKSAHQRDPRSDLTQLCGILFFCVTGLDPVALIDHNEQKPHQRPDAKKAMQRLAQTVVTRLNAIFDRAFELSVDRRWQSASDLRAALARVIAEVSPVCPSAPSVEDLRGAFLASTGYEWRKQDKEIVDGIVSNIRHAGQDLARELGSEFHTIQSGIPLDWATLTFGEQFGVQNVFFPERQFRPEFKGKITGNEVVVWFEDQDSSIELLRTALAVEPDWDSFRSRLREFYLSGLVSRAVS